MDSFEYQMDHLHESRASSLQTVNWCMIALSTVAVGLRVLSRRLVGIPLHYDDYSILLGQVLAYMCSMVIYESIVHGLGGHTLASSADDVFVIQKWHYAFNLCYCCGLPLVKLSMVFFYYRIFPSVSFRRALWFVGFLIAGTWVGDFFAAVFMCNPISYFWDKTIDGYCIDEYTLVMTAAAFTILFDLAILILPLPLVWNLKINRSQKAALTGIFILGSFVCIASIMRVPVIHLLIVDDPMWNGYWPGVWSLVELNFGIVCACLPTLRPIARAVAEHAWFSWMFSGVRLSRTPRAEPVSFVFSNHTQHQFVAKRKSIGGSSLGSFSSYSDSPPTTLHSRSTSDLEGGEKGYRQAEPMHLHDLGNLASDKSRALRGPQDHEDAWYATPAAQIRIAGSFGDRGFQAVSSPPPARTTVSSSSTLRTSPRTSGQQTRSPTENRPLPPLPAYAYAYAPQQVQRGASLRSTQEGYHHLVPAPVLPRAPPVYQPYSQGGYSMI